MQKTQMGKNRGEFFKSLQKELTSFGIEEANEEAERILEEVLGIGKVELYINSEEEVPPEAEKRLLKIIEGRKNRVPLAYLLGKADFWNETLVLNEECLVPRPETEILIEAIIKNFRDMNREFSFLDIGTGSGAIAVALLREFPNAHGTLLDVSEKALDAAGTNVSKYGLDNRATFIKGNLFTPFSAEDMWDLIVSNPPYLSEEDLSKAQPELKAEPRAALAGGKDGLEFYRRVIPEAKKHLKTSGALVFEAGVGQAETVSTWLHNAGYDNIQRFQDYLHIDRVVTANI